MERLLPPDTEEVGRLFYGLEVQVLKPANQTLIQLSPTHIGGTSLVLFLKPERSVYLIKYLSKIGGPNFVACKANHLGATSLKSPYLEEEEVGLQTLGLEVRVLSPASQIIMLKSIVTLSAHGLMLLPEESNQNRAKST